MPASGRKEKEGSNGEMDTKGRPRQSPPRSDRNVDTGLPKVRVRMYRQGLGDCFLLTFFPGGDERHVLIDCGTLGSQYTAIKLPDVIGEIRETTKGHLHLVVATHEHQDHLSGFSRLRDEFNSENGSIDAVWLAWTENPKDDRAFRLAKARDTMRRALKAAVQAMRLRGDDTGNADAIDSLLEFSDGSPSEHESAPRDGGSAFAAARNSMDIVRGFVKNPEYLSPGEPAIAPDWLPGFRFYVLGPPRNSDIFSDTGENGGSDLYALTAFAGAAKQLAATGKKPGGDDESPALSPFDGRFRVQRTDPMIVEGLHNSYFDESQSWRTIDNDWLNGAVDLAIKLDKLTNNTSLVLAIERVADGKVLLFPGDAQEGNWLSWQDPSIRWDLKGDNGKTTTVTAADLLARTVFYKVGHHSSHNATVKSHGLELMTRQSELTAFIPVDRQIALNRSPKGTWKMPARQLYRRLLEQCEGRVLRSDLGWAASQQGDEITEAQFAGLGNDAEWAEWKKSQDAAAHVKVTPTYVEFNLL